MVRFKMTYLIFSLCTLVLTNKIYADILSKNADNYGVDDTTMKADRVRIKYVKVAVGITGPYIVEWEHFDVCRGPKSLNVTELTTTLIKEDNIYRGILNVTFLENTKVDEIRIQVFTIKEGKKTPMWNYNVNKPCQHYMLAAMLEAHMGAKNCFIKKGRVVADLPMTMLMIKHIGTSFFYGEYLFKVTVNAKNANLACFYFDPKFKKKTKQ